MKSVVATFLLSTAGAAIAFHPALAGTVWMWVGITACQLPMALVSLRLLQRDEEVREVLQPRWGDLSLGIVSAAVLLGCVWGARLAVAPEGSAQHDWLAKAYRQAGDVAVLEERWLPLLLGVLVLSALEEIAWRGLVLPKIEERVGTRRAWPITGLLYGLTFLPTAWWLRGEAGPNPLIVAAAVLGGVAWSYLTARTRRLTPSILSHAVFLWFVVVQFRLMSLS